MTIQNKYKKVVCKKKKHVAPERTFIRFSNANCMFEYIATGLEAPLMRLI